MIRILIADDHAIVRQGLKQIVQETSDMAVADEATDGHEVLDKVSRNDYDCIILDISMPGKDGLDTLKQLHVSKPEVPVLLLSVHPEEQYAKRALKAGAAGYLTKKTAPDELISAIRRICRGGRYISPSLAERLAFDVAGGRQGLPHEGLSDREFQVMCLLASGKTVTQVAEQLALSVKTVSTYRTRILEKMGMNSNAELTHYAIKEGLVD